jgi:hypothetical protein
MHSYVKKEMQKLEHRHNFRIVFLKFLKFDNLHLHSCGKCLRH